MPELPPVTMKTLPWRSGSELGWNGMLEKMLMQGVCQQGAAATSGRIGRKPQDFFLSDAIYM
jgi:hypothetical protein